MGFFNKILGQQNRYTGVDIGTDSIKMVEIEATKSGLRLVNIGIEDTPSEAIEASIITEPQSIGEALFRLISREGFSRSAAVSSLAGQSLITRLIEVPRMGDAELSEAMKWEVERYIPFPAKEVVLDFKSLPTEDAEATQMEVLLVAAKKEMVNNHIAALNKAKLDLVAIDIEPLALSRSLIEACIQKDGDISSPNIMIVNIGASLTDITIIKDGNIGFNRGIPSGGKNVTQAISNFLLVGVEEAEQVKLNQTIIPRQDIVIDNSSAAAPIIDPATETVAEYDRLLNMDASADAPAAEDTGAIPLPETTEDTSKMLDLASFFSQSIKPEEETQPAGEAVPPVAEETAPATDKQPESDGGYQGLSLEALYGIESLDIGNIGAAAGPVPETENAAPAETPLSATVEEDDKSAQAEAPGYDPEKLMEAVRPSLQDIVNEIRRSLDYFRSRIKDSGNIDRIYISGGGSKLKNIDNFLEAELGIPVEIANPFSSIDTSAFDEKYINETASVFSIAVGLAVRELLDK